MKLSQHLLFVFLMSATVSVQAQVGIGIATPATSAQLDITSTTRGLLIPRMTASQRSPGIISPAEGLMVYQTDNIPGLYYFDGLIWQYGIGATGLTGSQGPAGNDGATGADGAITFVGVPATPTSTGTVGQQAYDSGNNLLYVCVATDTWVRMTPVATW